MYYSVLKTGTTIYVMTETPFSELAESSWGLNQWPWEGSEQEAIDMAGRLGSAYTIGASPRPH